MSSLRWRWAIAAWASVALVGGAAARAEEPGGGLAVGGAVPSVLELSITDMSPFSTSPAGSGESASTLSIGVEVSATDTPTQLSIADGSAAAGPRRGHLVLGSSIFAAPLQAAGAGGGYSSLDAALDPVLARWNQPVAHAATTIRLRQLVHGGSFTGKTYKKLVLVTVSTIGP